jgi:hypothetical protein
MTTTVKAARRQSKDPLERLDTPDWVTRVLLDKWPHVRGKRVVEPCAGAGRMSRVLSAEGGCAVRSFDIAPRADGIDRADAVSPTFWSETYRREIVVTNPAFSIASTLFRRAWAYDAPAIALLVRLSWLEAAEDRADLPDPDGLIVVPRPQFIESPEARAIREAAGKKWGGDSVTVAWAIWHPFSPKLGIIRINRAQKAIYERAPLFTET